MNGSEHRRGRDSVAQVLGHVARRDVARVAEVAVLLLGRERAGGQPVEQRLPARADHRKLRVVDVRVDEAGADQGVGVARDGRAGGKPRGDFLRRAAIDDAPVRNRDDRVGLVMACAGAFGERIAAKRVEPAADRVHLSCHPHRHRRASSALLACGADVRRIGGAGVAAKRVDVEAAATGEARETVSASQRQRAATSTKIRSTQCSWKPAWQRYDTR